MAFSEEIKDILEDLLTNQTPKTQRRVEKEVFNKWIEKLAESGKELNKGQKEEL